VNFDLVFPLPFVLHGVVGELPPLDLWKFWFNVGNPSRAALLPLPDLGACSSWCRKVLVPVCPSCGFLPSVVLSQILFSGSIERRPGSLLP
jgi:hypothetical protein